MSTQPTLEDRAPPMANAARRPQPERELRPCAVVYVSPNSQQERDPVKKRERRQRDGRVEVLGAEVESVSDQVATPLRNVDQNSFADRDYGFSGRCGFQEGFYSGYYGRGTAGERDTPSPSGYAGAGYDRGGTDIPRPDREPRDAVRVDGARYDYVRMRLAYLLARIEASLALVNPAPPPNQLQ
jgi:hypothetical protein